MQTLSTKGDYSTRAKPAKRPPAAVIRLHALPAGTAGTAPDFEVLVAWVPPRPVKIWLAVDEAAAVEVAVMVDELLVLARVGV
jgi:hypothetical protein